MSENTRQVQDERVTAALAHGVALIPMMGIIASIIIWATQKDKSRFVAFQALQALLYQVMPILGGILFFVCYFCSFFAMFLVIPGAAFMDSSGSGDMGEALVALLALLPMGAPFCVMGLFLLALLAYLGYALYAAVRVLQGDDFRYILIGRWLDRYLNPEEAAA